MISHLLSRLWSHLVQKVDILVRMKRAHDFGARAFRFLHDAEGGD